MTNGISNEIKNDYYLPANDPNFKVTDKPANGDLGKDAFLKILITQLQNQDPTSPMDDKEFIAQMAQFSSLEQMQNMTKAMEGLLASQQQTQMMSYTSFIGKEVKWHELTDKLDENKKPIFNEGTGVIKELKFVDGDVVFILADGKEISPGNISSILGSGNEVTAPSNPMVEASNLIGENIQYKKDDQFIDAIIEAITVKNGIVEYILNDGTRLKRDDFTLVEQEDNTTDKDDTTDKKPSDDTQTDDPTV
ncbi:flagellar hook assembly protein FlgD [Solibacillus sp. FSL K6-1523]|uniref:flagellar hook assembly protein FlgD n=1 Tax=Solibacillus sp. FSL K6-1523 TaxID=2921471 RepID=UPI0030F684CF